MRALPLRRRGKRRGQALVEFALVFPIFLMVLFSIIAFGLYIFYNQQLANAAR
jgi:Flp pilus assembly protein TadG